MPTLSLRAALVRGALITAANWPVVLIEFTVESFFKLALTIPILGGALMVTALAGTDLSRVIGDTFSTADVVMGSLASAPVALTSFLAAVAIVAFGGGAIVFTIKTGTLSVLVASERSIEEIDRPIHWRSLRRASAYSVEAIYEGIRHFGRRALMLSLWLGAAYFAIGVTYLAVMDYGLDMATRVTRLPAWPLVVLAGTTVALVAIAVVNLTADLLRVIVVTDDCGVRKAVGRLRRLVGEDARQVIGILAIMGAVVVLAMVASMAAASGLALAAWMPFAGLLVLPFQALAWVMRGVFFQYLALGALSAYQTQYRRFSDDRWPRRERLDTSTAPAGE